MHNVEKPNEDTLFPIITFFKLSREFRIVSLFWMIQKDLRSEKKFLTFVIRTLNMII